MNTMCDGEYQEIVIRQIEGERWFFFRMQKKNKTENKERQSPGEECGCLKSFN